MRISDWSSDVCSSDLVGDGANARLGHFAVVDGDIGADAEATHPLGQAKLIGPGIKLKLRRGLGPEDAAVAAIGDAREDIVRTGSEERRVGKECGSTCRAGWST